MVSVLQVRYIDQCLAYIRSIEQMRVFFVVHLLFYSARIEYIFVAIAQINLSVPPKTCELHFRDCTM